MRPFLVTTLNLQKTQPQKLYTMHDLSGFLWEMKGLYFASGLSWSFKIQSKRTLVYGDIEKPEEFTKIME